MEKETRRETSRRRDVTSRRNGTVKLLLEEEGGSKGGKKGLRKGRNEMVRDATWTKATKRSTRSAWRLDEFRFKDNEASSSRNKGT